MPKVNRMCFRAGFVAMVAAVAGLWTGGADAAQADGVQPELRLVSVRPGLIEVSLPAEAGEPDTLQLRVPGRGQPGRRAPFRPDPADPDRLIARLSSPTPLLPGRTLRLEVRALNETGRWVLSGRPMFVRGGVPSDHGVPDWAKGVVWYQVFPERFRNGNPDNDPYAWDRTVVGWDRSPEAVSGEEIEMQWNRRLVEPRFFSADPTRWWGAVGQVVFQRRYGGDLQGVVERLDHIAGLGVTGLYLCPVFEARSLHKYEASDHRHVDPTLGHPGTPGGRPDRSGEDPADETTWAWEPADRYLVETLLPEARRRGMRVILDGVWNHVGRDHFAFRDVLENGRDSAYADWFKVEFDDEGRVLRYEAWDRPNGALPEFRQTPEGDLAPGPKAHVFAVTRRWMDPNGDGDPSDGVDGWRLDVAPEIGTAFWRSWREFVRSINPDALLVGEVWTDAARWFEGEAFDAQMNYPLAHAVADWLSIGQAETDAARFAERVNKALHHHPAHTLAQMNLIASHDTERGASLMHNRTERGFDSGATPWTPGSAYDAGPVDDEARRRLLAAYALLTALPGSPMVYNGDEFAMAGADDPDNRRPIPWDEAEDGAMAAFRDAVSAVLGLRAHPEVGSTLRYGSSEVVPGPGDGVVVRRWIDSGMVEVAVARTGEAAFLHPLAGWEVAHEVEIPGGGAVQGVRLRLLERVWDR